MKRTLSFTLSLVASLTGCSHARADQPEAYPPPPMGPAQLERAADLELSRREFQPHLNVALGDLRSVPAAADALRKAGFIQGDSRRFVFTDKARSVGSACTDGTHDCLRLPFGRNSTRFGKMVELYSPGDKFSQLWTVWLTYRIVPTDMLSKLADRDGFVETISAAGTACPTPWRSQTVLLESLDLARPDMPETLVGDAGLSLRGHAHHPSSADDVSCALRMYQTERDETPEGARHDIAP